MRPFCSSMGLWILQDAVSIHVASCILWLIVTCKVTRAVNARKGLITASSNSYCVYIKSDCITEYSRLSRLLVLPSTCLVLGVVLKTWLHCIKMGDCLLQKCTLSIIAVSKKHLVVAPSEDAMTSCIRLCDHLIWLLLLGIAQNTANEANLQK